MKTTVDRPNGVEPVNEANVIRRTPSWLGVFAALGVSCFACARSGSSRSAPSAQAVQVGRAHVARVRSIDVEDADFADLAAVGLAIGDARVVMLGEAGHGDGATFPRRHVW